MAGDWIKMRVSLRKDPCVIAMADYLAADRSFMNYLTDPVQQSCQKSAHEHITRDVTRAITVCSLLEVWGVARDRGDRDGDDLVVKHCTINAIDDICGVPTFGEAMEYVEWAVEEEVTDAKGRPSFRVRFPKFFKDHESPEDRYKKQHAEAQARYREKQRSKDDESGDITSDITVTPREEKRREEKKTRAARSVAKPDGVSDSVWTDFLALRKAKRAPLTDTALAGIEREAQKAGLTLPQAIQKCIDRNWQGFDASWLADKPAAGNAPWKGAK